MIPLKTNKYPSAQPPHKPSHRLKITLILQAQRSSKKEKKGKIG